MWFVGGASVIVILQQVEFVMAREAGKMAAMDIINSNPKIFDAYKPFPVTLYAYIYYICTDLLIFIYFRI